MKNIIKIIESIPPSFKGEIVYLSTTTNKYEIDITCDFEEDKHEIEVYDIKKDRNISISNGYWNKIIDYCYKLLQTEKQERLMGFDWNDRQHQERLIH
jgi:hypothetical protein